MVLINPIMASTSPTRMKWSNEVRRANSTAIAVILVPMASIPITRSGMVGPMNARYPQNKVRMQIRIKAEVKKIV